MKIFLDCLPCMLKQVLEASRMAAGDEEAQERIINDSLKILSDYKQYACSPDLAAALHQTVKKHTKVSDPYKLIKEKDIAAAEKVYPVLKSYLQNKQDKLYAALKIAATGNIIDSAIYSNIDIENCIEKELNNNFSICDVDYFAEKLKKAETLLIIGDNAGETVFDKVLAEYLAPLDIFYAVRSEPVINDATIEDAYCSGLEQCMAIISTGCNAPGAVLEKCSPEFMCVFNKADIVISKGQGNYEALSDCNREVFFLLKAKCSMIAKKLNVHLNEYVFMTNDNKKT
ncbi:MAG: damage-control phosphatase ARMT1 family protein [Eubacteriales bacterium]